MTFTPERKVKKPNDSNLILEAVIYFMLSFTVIYTLPYLIIFFGSPGRSGTTIRHSDILLQIMHYLNGIYQTNKSTLIFASIFLGLCISVFIMFRKRYRMHLIQIDLNQESLLFTYINLMDTKKFKTINLNTSYLACIHEDEANYSNPKLEIRLKSHSGKILLSTKRSKYWSYYKDKDTILKLFKTLRLKRGDQKSIM